MIRKMLYKVKNADGSETVSLEKPAQGTRYQIRWRLIAEEGKAITDGILIVGVIDLVHRKDGERWRDCILPEYMKPPTRSK